MTQDDIRSYYREHWGNASEAKQSGTAGALSYSSPIEDAIIYPVYEQLIADLGIRMNNASVLDIGSGSGRWIRFMLDRYTPSMLTGVDFAETSVMLLNEWSNGLDTPARVSFFAADISEPGLQIESAPDDGFYTINVANVLFHVPEPDKFQNALKNLAALIADDGHIITTEYLPRTSMRTEWMAVRSRYEFEQACANAGLRIADTRACSFFSNDPMGIDGPDDATRKHFHQVRSLTKQLLDGVNNDQSRAFITQLFAEIEHACLSFCTERIAQIDMPAQKLVVLRRA